MRRWQAVVFDLDDTLFPERQYVLSGLRAVAGWAQSQFGIPGPQCAAEFQSLFEAGVRGDLFDRWLASHGQEPAKWVGSMVEAYRNHVPSITPFPEVPPLLDRLRGQGCRLGLVSDGRWEVQQRKFDALRLRPCFQAVVFSDVLGRDAWKPSPVPFLCVLEQLGTCGEEAVYVGDNPAKDFRGARRVGMASIRMRHLEGLYRHLEPGAPEDAPDGEVGDFAELERRLEQGVC